jgi:hypothetical protein
MILDPRGIAVARCIIGDVCAKRRPSGRRRTDFFFEHAAATITPAWEIYHGASDSIEPETLNKRVGDATQQTS